MKQLTLFDLSLVAPPAPPTVYDPAWDEDDTVNCQIASFEVDNSSFAPESQSPLAQEFLLVGAQVSLATPANTVKSLVGAQVNTDTKKVAPQHDTTHWVEKYWVERGGNKYWYYRYCWMTGRKKNRIYIGSVNSVIAKNRKLEVESAIADSETPAQIEDLIRSWRKP